MSELKPIVMSGPSGCGKSTLLNKLFAEFPNAFGFSVSHTTRQPRAGEVDGQHYHFVKREDILREISEGKFIEHAEFSGNVYGTSKKAVQDVLDEGRLCILDIDEQGVKNMKNVDLDPVYIFIKPPSLKELRARLEKRGTETSESVEKRMKTAITAIQYSEENGVYDFILLNDDLEIAYSRLKTFTFSKFPSLISMGHPSPQPVSVNQSNIDISIPITSDERIQQSEEPLWNYCTVL